METPTIFPKNAAEWREWLILHHAQEKGVWVQMPSKKSGIEGISWSTLVEHALCFGWVDSKKVKLDDVFSKQYVSPRKPKSTWSKINKTWIDKLHVQGMMYPAGSRAVEIAKQNGSWQLLDTVDALEIPPDLEATFLKFPGSKEWFTSKSPSYQKLLLASLVLAKTAATRQKRIDAFLVANKHLI